MTHNGISQYRVLIIAAVASFVAALALLSQILPLIDPDPATGDATLTCNTRPAPDHVANSDLCEDERP